MATIFGGLLYCVASAENDQVSERNPLVTRLPVVEVVLNGLKLFEHRREFRRVVDWPILLWLESNSRTVRAPALVGASERRCRCPGSRNELRDRQSRIKDPRLQRLDVLLVDKFVINGGDRVLPD